MSIAQIYRFVILVPHRDVQMLLKKKQEENFSMGLHGAYSFPLAAPLAMVSKALNGNELRELALEIRELCKENNSPSLLPKDKAKIICKGNSVIHFRDNFSFYGPILDLPMENLSFFNSIKGKIIQKLPKTVLSTALLDSKTELTAKEAGLFRTTTLKTGENSAFYFRAAALANLTIAKLNAGDAVFSFRWKMSPLKWLP